MSFTIAALQDYFRGRASKRIVRAASLTENGIVGIMPLFHLTYG